MSSERVQPEQLVATFEGYGQPRDRWLIGGEFERTLVRKDGRPVGYFEPDGIRWILDGLARRDGWDEEYEGDHPIALWKDGASITLEPGGQVELSGAPHRTLGALALELQANRQAMLEVVEGHDLRWIAAGLTPIADIEDVPWVPKGRYEVMRRFLPLYGDLAHYMMKGTASVQVNFDYGDERDCARKVQLSAGMAPLTTAIFAHSPLYKNQWTGFKSYRAHIWTRTDPRRTGFPPALLHGYSHQGWVDYLLDVPMMFYKYGGTWRPAEGRTFRDYMAHGHEGHFPDAKEWELHQTSVFPEVRVKRTIEIRSADCVDADLAIAFCAFFTGLLYDDGAMDEGLALIEDFEREGSPTERLALASRAALDATVGGRRMADWARDLGAIADRGLRRVLPADAHLLAPLLARLESGRSPADDLLDAWKANPDPSAVIEAVRY